MIFVDPRDGGIVKKPGVDNPSDRFVKLIRGQGISAYKSRLDYGDFAFKGNLRNGEGMIGVERKTLHDMLHCINDARFNEQRIGMMRDELGNPFYNKSFLILEGEWKPHDESLILMQGYQDKDNRTSWGYLKHRTNRLMYSQLYNYLLSVAETGVTVTYSRNLF